MLKKLRLIDFKSFADESVELAPLTLLVGANASGKSNFLDALRFLQMLPTPITLKEILEGGSLRALGWNGIRGGATETARIGTSAFTLESVWESLHQDLGPEAVCMVHTLTCRTQPRPCLDFERLATVAGKQIFYTKAGDDEQGELVVLTNGMELSSSGPVASVSPGLHSALSGLKGLHGTNDEDLLYLSMLLTVLSSVESYDFYPDAMRWYGRAGSELDSMGQNLSGVLSDLCSDASEKQLLVQWLAELCAPELADIDFIRVRELGDVMAVLVEKDGRRVTARSLSDGTLRFLGTLVALYDAKPGSIIVIEEIAEGLHPARVRVLMEWLQAVCRERSIQILATTHSPTALQWLDEESLGNVVLFARTPEHEGTIMRRLRDLPHFFEVVRRVGIHEMFTTSWLEMAL